MIAQPDRSLDIRFTAAACVLAPLILDAECAAFQRDKPRWQDLQPKDQDFYILKAKKALEDLADPKPVQKLALVIGRISPSEPYGIARFDDVLDFGEPA